jgi:ABC-type polysaccharide/polyol phosphate transport system ATPase subunit
MNAAVIQTAGLGKRYRRGVRASRGMLRDTLMDFARDPLAVLRRASHESFWALEDVSLEVNKGEVLGLIGRNGAGKTTLLKILSRITRPTTGWAEIHGRVRSLLEVGTGFHSELTGRENAYLSGSILGMSKREINRKLDEIVAFAEIEKFIDTPVKHYSSGMYVRLAFAVAAHLEPEILLVDEVLAVGDINFQKKCLGRMGDVAQQGRTVVLVSHQMNQMRRLCHRVVWMDGGHIRMTGSAHEVVSAYESAMARGDRLPAEEDHSNQQDRGHRKGRFVGWEIATPRGEDPHTVTHLGSLTVKFTVRIHEPVLKGIHGIALYNHDRQLIWGWAAYGKELAIGEHEFCHTFPMLPVRPGPYSWLVSLYDDAEEVDVWEALPEMIVATDVHQHQYDQWNGVLNIPTDFSISAKVEAFE